MNEYFQIESFILILIFFISVFIFAFFSEALIFFIDLKYFIYLNNLFFIYLKYFIYLNNLFFYLFK